MKRSARLPIYDVNRLTPAEKKMLEEYAKTRNLAEVARNFGLTNGCVQIRGKSIREKLSIKNLDEAFEKGDQT